MKRISIGAILVSAMCVAVVGCGSPPQTQEEKVKQQVSQNQYSLTADERQASQINGKTYFDKSWITADGARGQLNNCRPSDSNSNGMVSCTGFVPQPGGSYKETKMYCGYRPEVVGCSDEDTVRL